MDDWFQDPFFNMPNDPSKIEQDIRNQISEVEHHMTKMINSMNHMFKEFASNSMFGLDFDDKHKNGSGKHSTTAPGLTYHPTFSDSNEFDQTITRKSSKLNQTHTKEPIVEYPEDDFRTSSRNRSTNNYDYNSRTYNGSNYNTSDNYDRSRTRDFNRTQSTSNRESKPYIYTSSMSSYTGPDGIQQARKKTYDSDTGKTQMAEMRRLGDQAIAIKREIDRDGKVTDTVDRKNVDEKDVSDFRHRWDTKANQMSLGFRNSTGTRQNALK